ncbi:uncharacterized protein BBOV_IV008930 [Babesia bovis T2Bo]|uniref:DNA recombination and repair protein Rad51-like C-terminal domain-containing protein n=1 Tax=Babesia bovis TaxID=5865 RepID=A7ARS8_BABBO|nr:uncharacterized protein BBOV_IV008930 [Babesia bovis T2Bo]EDO07247.1 hypothetical protein BBOV_IV008930 [Babesia bovis T2Bo]|eukprot:XP_001610815.1 hypothetical protein [Babesia bovis T2Bo]
MDCNQKVNTDAELQIPIAVLNQSALFNSNEYLFSACTGTSQTRGVRGSESQASQPIPLNDYLPFINKRNSCDSTVEVFSVDPELKRTPDSSFLFSDLCRSSGIAEITGGSGSGKTSFCVGLVNISSGLTLYIDTNGSLALPRILNQERFLYLRLFDHEELDIALSEFYDALVEDNYLARFSSIRARSVSTLIVDSLWPLCLLSYAERVKYIVQLCYVLRDISWTYKVMVLVCTNDSYWDNKPIENEKDERQESVKDYFTSRCYVQVSFKNILSFNDYNCSTYGVYPAKRDPITGRVRTSLEVRRLMNIYAGTCFSGHSINISIKRHGLEIFKE